MEKPAACSLQSASVLLPACCALDPCQRSEQFWRQLRGWASRVRVFFWLERFCCCCLLKASTPLLSGGSQIRAARNGILNHRDIVRVRLFCAVLCCCVCTTRESSKYTSTAAASLCMSYSCSKAAYRVCCEMQEHQIESLNAFAPRRVTK